MQNTPQLTFNQKIANLLAAKPVILQVLRFGAIGTLNTALDFIILNYVTESFGVVSGVSLGLLNVISFSAAVIQSYLWNRAWTFASFNLTPFSNAFRLVVVGALGFTAFLLVIFGGLQNASTNYYLFILIVFIVTEIIIWYAFGLKLSSKDDRGVGQQFAVFLFISLIGLMINSGIVALASTALAPSLSSLINAASIKNAAKILATGVSLIWNFLGYKLVVFKK